MLSFNTKTNNKLPGDYATATLLLILFTHNNPASPMQNQMTKAVMELRMLPVMCSREPHMTSPNIIANFSHTS